MHIFRGWCLAWGCSRESTVGIQLAWVVNLMFRFPIGRCIFSWWALMLCCRLWIIYIFYCFYYLVNDDLHLLTTRLFVRELFFTVNRVLLCCLTYVIRWKSRVKASFKHGSILITKVRKRSSFLLLSFFLVGKQSSFLLLSFLLFLMVFLQFCVCFVALVISFSL